MLKRIARIGVWFFGLVAAAMVVWLVANRTSDPALTPQAKVLLEPRQPIADDRNVAVGMLGLTAPSGTDFMRYGAEIKALYASNAPNAQIQTMTAGPNTLRPTVTGWQADGWLAPEGPSFKGNLPLDQAATVLRDNQELLSRYKSLYALDGYSGPGVYHNEAFLVVNRLAIAEMQLDLRNGRPELAYTKWREHLRFVKRNMHGESIWVAKAIGLVALGMSTTPFLDSLLAAAPNTVKKHAAELDEDLRFNGTEAMNPDGIVRTELQLFRHALAYPPQEMPWGIDRLHWLAFHLGQKNRMLNRYAEFAPEYVGFLRGKWEDRQKEADRLREKHVYRFDAGFALDPFGSLMVAQFIDSQLRAKELARQAIILDSRMRLARLTVRLANQNVADSRIQAFLDSSGPAFLDPFSHTPARWDPKDRKIYFVDPDEKCTVMTWLRVPDRRSPRNPTSEINTNVCERP